MKRSLLIASAVAAVLAGQAMAESGNDPAIDEKCYGVSPHDVSECGSDPQTCARDASAGTAAPANAGGAEAPKSKADEWAYVPKGTCVKVYGGSLTPPKTS